MRIQLAVANTDPYDPDDTEILALCTDAEGLYVDPPKPERDRYELVGCAPEGRLSEAAANPQEDGTSPVGVLYAVILDPEGQPIDPPWLAWWGLQDVRVLAVRPSAAGDGLVDITVEAALEEWDEVHEHQPDVPEQPPRSRGFRLEGRDEQPWGHCREVRLVGDKQPEPAATPLQLLGCEARGTLLAALHSGDDDFTLGGVHIGVLDRTGRVVQEDWFNVDIETWKPSALGDGLFDLTLDVYAFDERSAARRRVHEIWWSGPPAEPNLWASLDTAARECWPLVTMKNHQQVREHDAPPGGTYHLDGRHVTDVPGFLCALGEAMNGPGTYFGWGLWAMDDCLKGGFGVEAPLTLVWHDHHIARTCLGMPPLANPEQPTFEYFLATLAAGKVEVVLD